MPNWCSNLLLIKSENKDLLEYLAQVWTPSNDSDNGFSLELIIPMPDELRTTTSPTQPGQKHIAREMTKKYGYPDWYEWAIKNWGTKWDIDPKELTVSLQSDNLKMTFLTAWSPPIPVLMELTRIYKVEIETIFLDECWNFAGKMSIADSQVLYEKSLDPKTAAVEVFGQVLEDEED